jgi:hypothetical protein
MKAFFAIIVLLATTAHSDERTKALCRSYVEGFVSPATDLVYGKRLNGPRGLAVLESPAEIANGRVGGEQRPYGYGSGIEDTAYQTGMLLFALCDAEEATGDPYFAELARRAFRGLERMSTLSPVEGFVPRGPHPADGKTYYRDSSLDQHSLYVCGLWRYHRSRLASPAEKESIRAIIGKVIRRLEKAQWIIKVEDGSAPSKAGGSMLLWEPRTAALLLMMLAAAHDVTGDAHWKDEYDRFSGEQDGRRWALLAKEIDRSRERRYTLFMNQHALRVETLRRIEPSAERKAVLRRHLEATAEDMLAAPYFRAWRSLDWIGEESWEDASKKEVANAYLQPLGVTLDSPVTVMDLWRKFDLNRVSPPALRGRRNRYEPIALATPAMVWQIALLSRKPELIRQVQPVVCEMLERVDFNRIDLGWASNYAILVALWNVAQSSNTGITVSGTRFLLNGQPFNYTGVSVFNAIYNPTFNKSSAERTRWLEKFRRYGVNVLRVWCQWDNKRGFADAGPDSTLYLPDGRLREAPLATLKAILTDADRLGMVVELCLFSHESFREDIRLDSDKSAAAVTALTRALQPHRNLTFQIWNEHHDDNVLPLVRAIKALDPHRLVTSSPGFAGVLGTDDLNEALDYLTPHTSRQNKGNPWELAPREIASLLEKFQKPVVDDEPARCGMIKFGGPKGPTSPDDHIRQITAVRKIGGYITYHHDMFQTGYGSPSVPPSGIPDPEFSPYHRAVFKFIAQSKSTQ